MKKILFVYRELAVVSLRIVTLFIDRALFILKPNNLPVSCLAFESFDSE